MITNYLYLLAILAILIAVGFKLRGAGKDIENKNLIQAGTIWLVINGASILFTLVMIITISLKGSEVCNCSDIYLDFTKKAKAANGDPKKIEAIPKKYKKEIDACNDFFEEKFGSDQKKMDNELLKCPSYVKVLKLMEEQSKKEQGQVPIPQESPVPDDELIPQDTSMSSPR